MLRCNTAWGTVSLESKKLNSSCSNNLHVSLWVSTLCKLLLLVLQALVFNYINMQTPFKNELVNWRTHKSYQVKALTITVNLGEVHAKSSHQRQHRI